MSIGTMPEHLMRGFADQICGIRLISNTFLPVFCEVPVRKHKLKTWMTKTKYHLRIQKKWNKRFGFKTERAFYRHGDSLSAHPTNIELVKNLL